VLEFDRISTRELLLALPESSSLHQQAPSSSYGHAHDDPQGEPRPVAISAPAVRRRPWRRMLAVTVAALGLASGAAALVAIQVPNASRTLDVTATATTPGAPPMAPARPHRPRAASVPAEAPAAEAAEAAPLPAEAPRSATSAKPARPRTTAASEAADAAKDDAAKADAALSAAQLFSEANQARRASNPARATELYRLLQRKFPNSQEAQLSLVTLGSLQLNGGNAAGALATFNRYLNRGGRSLEAEALYGQAQALRRLGRTGDERRAWERLLARHPGSGYAPQARERLDSLGGS